MQIERAGELSTEPQHVVARGPPWFEASSEQK